MRQLTMTAERAVEWLDVPEPALEGDREALVRPLAVALCDLDQPILRGEAPIPGPIALGHEFVAEVVEAGHGAGVAPGDRVIVPFQISCGECERCRRGHTANCTTVRPGSMYGFGAFGGDWGGALSDLVRVPFADHMLVGVPASIEAADVASASDNIPDGWRTVAEPLAENPGADVLVVGGGAPSIGLYAVDSAFALGAGAVTYIDDDAERLALAERLGAEVVEGPPPERHGSHAVTVNATLSHEGLACAVRSTESEGTCTSVGIYFEAATPVPMLEMYTKGITLRTGRVQARPAIPAILEQVEAGRLRPQLVTSALVPWEEAPDAVRSPERKLVIRREPSGG